VDIDVGRGELFGLLGPNGAGKTTLIKILCTLLRPTRGTASVNGFDVWREPKKAKAQIGSVLDVDSGWYGRLTGRQNLRFYADVFLVPRHEAQRRIDDVLELTGMSGKADDWHQKLSTGERRRLDIARALLSDPPVLILDEPTLGLDVASARKLRAFIRDDLCRGQGRTVLLTTHYLAEADEICDRVAIIDRGRIVACDDPMGIKKLMQPIEILEVEASGVSPQLKSRIEAIEGVAQVSVVDLDGDRVKLSIGVSSPDAVAPRICKEIIGTGGDILLVNRGLPTLEDSFLRLTKGAGA
jgi:ABC-2 type transport system ATP-binding protein